MKRLAACLLALILLACAFIPADAELTAEQIEEADRFFTRLFTKATAVGGAVLVNRGGERVYAFYQGKTNKKNGVPVDENTVYKVASVTKLVAAIGIMKLADEGRLDLDAPIDIGGGNTITHPRYPDIPVTLRQCMSHTSGLLGGAPYQDPPAWTSLTRNDTKFFSRYAPGAHFEYSNLNGGILCSVIERVTGQSFNTYMAENVFQPLGVNAAFSAALLPDAEPLSGTYDPNDSLYMSAAKYLQEDAEAYEDTCDPDSHYRYSVGSLYISVSGLEKLGAMLANDGAVDGVRVLSADAVLTMGLDQALLIDSTVACESPYGLCTLRFETGGVTWYGHQGRWQGLLTDLFYEPRSKTALVFVLNGMPMGAVGREVNLRVEDAMNEVASLLGLAQ